MIHTSPLNETNHQIDAKILPFQTISAEALQAKEFPPLEFIVDKLLVPGMTILAGRPKEGKSWLALALSAAVANGGHALGSLVCGKGSVLYLALEDNERRLKYRLQMLYPYDDAWTPNLEMVDKFPRLDNGGLKWLQQWVDLADNPKLIVIDVYAKVKMQSGDGYEADYRAAAPLQEFAVENGIAVLCIHHTRKMAADDPLESVSGTNGLTGAADSILVLRREAINNGNAVLYGRGRDISECELALCFDETSCHWSHRGNAAELRASKESQEIIDALSHIGEPAGAKAIAELLPHLNTSVVSKRLYRMSDRGEVRKTSYGVYEPVQPVEVSNYYDEV